MAEFWPKTNTGGGGLYVGGGGRTGKQFLKQFCEVFDFIKEFSVANSPY